MLTVAQRVAFGGKNIVFDIHPKGDEQVDDDGRAHRQERNINKVFADGGRGDAHFFADIRAYAEYMPFHKLP